MIFGGFGVLANVLIYQQKTGKKLLVYKLISDVFWGLHYLFLAAYSAFAIACIGLIRESVFLNQGKKWADSKLWFAFFALLSVGSAALTWKGVMSVLPALASLLSVFGFWRANPKLSRILAYPISACMLAYDIYVASYVGIINEAFTLVSTTVAVVIMVSAARKNKCK